MQLVLAVACIETVSLALACAWGAAGADPWWRHLEWNAWAALGGLAGLAMGGSGIALLRVARARSVRAVEAVVDELLVPVFKDASVPAMLAVSIMSGTAEEALFRGQMQPAWGMAVTTLVFAALHAGGRRFLFMAAWSAVASLALGWLYAASGTLWCPMLCHGVNNLASMLYVRYCHTAPPSVSMEQWKVR